MSFDIIWVEGLVCLVLAELADMRGKRTIMWGWTAAAFVAWGRALWVHS